MDFIKERDEIINYMLLADNKVVIEQRFFSFFEKIIVDMMEGENNFFGAFMIQIKREINYLISWPLETVPTANGFKMYINPPLFINGTKNEMQAMIKHEIYHIMYGHYEREQSLRSKYSKFIVNVALDISINQFIKNLPAEYKRLNSINLEYGLELKDNMTCEYYAEELHNYFKRNENKVVVNSGTDNRINIETAHDLWWKESISQEIIENISKNASINAYKGKAPKDIEDIILAYNSKAEISWQKALKNMLPSVRAGYKKISTRRDRRQPERMDIKGVLTNNIPEIIVAIDISASMSDDEIKNIMIEILDITKLRSNKITVIECDYEIRCIYEMKSIKDIKKRTSNKGATAFTPVFKHIRDNNLRNAILIYFTDGAGERELDVKAINKNTIWVLTGEQNLSLNNPKGVIKRINVKKEVGEGGSSALEIMRMSINYWGR